MCCNDFQGFLVLLFGKIERERAPKHEVNLTAGGILPTGIHIYEAQFSIWTKDMACHHRRGNQQQTTANLNI